MATSSPSVMASPSSPSRWELIVELLTNPYSCTLYERHISAIELAIRDCEKVSRPRDVTAVATILSLQSRQVRVGEEKDALRLTRSLCSLLDAVEISPQARIPASHHVALARSIEAVLSLRPLRSELIVSCLNAAQRCLPRGTLDVGEIDNLLSSDEIDEQVMEDILRWWCAEGPRRELHPRLQVVVEHLREKFSLPSVTYAIEVLWDAVEDDDEVVLPLLSSWRSIQTFSDITLRLERDGFRKKDLEMMNDLLSIFRSVLLHPKWEDNELSEVVSHVLDVPLFDLLVRKSTEYSANPKQGELEAKIFSWQILSQCLNVNDDALVKLTQVPSLFLWTLVRHIFCGFEEEEDEVFPYESEDVDMKEDLRGKWKRLTFDQRVELQQEAVITLTRIVWRCSESLLHYSLPQSVLSLLLPVMFRFGGTSPSLLHTASLTREVSIIPLLREGGLAVIPEEDDEDNKDPLYPLTRVSLSEHEVIDSVRVDVIVSLAEICASIPLWRRVFVERYEGVEVLCDMMERSVGKDSVRMVVVHMLWLLLGRREDVVNDEEESEWEEILRRFLEHDGVSRVFSILEDASSSTGTEELCLGLLSDLLHDESTRTELLEWKSITTYRDVVQLLLALWYEEEVRIGTSPPSEILRERETTAESLGISLHELNAKDIRRPTGVRPSSIHAKIYTVLRVLGFPHSVSLDTEERKRLVFIERYPEVREGEVWMDISEELSAEGVRPVGVDRDVCRRAHEELWSTVGEIASEQQVLDAHKSVMEEEDETMFYEQILEQKSKQERAKMGEKKKGGLSITEAKMRQKRQGQRTVPQKSSSGETTRPGTASSSNENTSMGVSFAKQ